VNLSARLLQCFGALLLLIVSATGAARAADLSQAVMLVATANLAGSGYEEAVLLAAPLPKGGHMGFIVNRPTSVKLASLFPEHAPSSKVIDPVYLGGPVLPESLFAVTRKAPEGDEDSIALMPGLVAVFSAASVDRIIETTPNDARYFVGLVVWRPGELDEQIRAGTWAARPADVDSVLPKS
jgi:putative transcriptional regulator